MHFSCGYAVEISEKQKKIIFFNFFGFSELETLKYCVEN